jgi:RimJ/RimL family protein N-acetyltransferase
METPAFMKLIKPESLLRSKRLLLEPQVEAHAALLHESLCEDSLYTFVPQNPPRSAEAFAALVARFRKLSTRLSPDGKEAWLNWVLKDRASGNYVGTVEATVHQNLTANIAYQTFTGHLRQGYAKEACGKVIEHLFQDYGVQFVEALIDTRNTASIKLVESLGFRLCEVINGADFFKGCNSNEFRYRLNNIAGLL